MSGLTLKTHVSNLKSVALTVLELLAYNAQQCDWPVHCAHTHTDRWKQYLRQFTLQR